MAGRIPQEFIDELMNRVDIVEVIDQRVPLKKAGREYKACCPFHNERTPSFTVSAQKQFYHCFGCGAHGTALGFLMEYEHLDFVEAVEQLAAGIGLEVPRTAGVPRGPSQQPLYTVMEKAAHHYQQQLRHHPARQKAVDYLKGRGLSGEIAKRFALGYAPEGWDNLITALGGEQEALERLVESGMVVAKENGRHYDRFRNRIMFPIRDARGRVVAFGGRVLESNDRESAETADKRPGATGPKYLNSPETPIFHKGRELYGLYEARQALRDIPRLLVVEGYMDVVALAQFGIHYAVATLGTSVTAEHLDRLFRITPEVVFCFDGDRAGRDAAWRGLENGLRLMRDGRQLRFMFLPEGEDPDTLIRRIGAEDFAGEVDQATPLSRFFFDQLSRTTDLDTLDGRARLVELARPYLSNLPPGAYRQLMATELAHRAGMAPEQLSPLLGEAPTARPAVPAPQPQRAQEKQIPSPVRHALALLLHQPDLALHAGIPDFLESLRLPGTQLLLEILELLHEQPHLTPGALLERWRGVEAGRHLEALARRPLAVPEGADLQQEFLGALARLEEQWRRRRRETLFRLSRERTLSQEERRELEGLLRKKAAGANPERE